MATNALNLIKGPARLWIGSFGVTEPTTANFTVEPTAGWTDLGFTNGGVTLNLTREYSPFEVDQLTLSPGTAVVSEEISVATSLAEATVENLAIAMNSGTVATAATYKTYEPDDNLAGAPTAYKAIMLRGLAPANASGVAQTRVVILRKVLSTEGVELAYNKEDQTQLDVTFMGFWVSSSVRAYKIFDQVGV